ncbi:hypothetical protein K474DRAFT_330693 [Panus rudis PR-1116 ss-1]|nr:hypothetical protein K474DRAFT_330693 [Panus rudis PR-1116 ss-1]
MPSLRRTLSSPSVRSSPYYYPSSSSSLFSSSSSSSHSQTRQGGHGPTRRSSGSETAQRRVLADIDWWRVEEGQRELRGLPPLRLPAEVDDENVVREVPPPVASVFTDVPLWQPAPGSGAAGDESDYTFSVGVSSESTAIEPPSPVTEFAALSISARVEAHRRLTSTSASSDSDSSFESMPSPTLNQASLAPFSDLVFSDIVPRSPDMNVPSLPSLPRALRRGPALTGRSVSYSLVESEVSYGRGNSQFEDPFADFCNDEFFARTRVDEDDLFF